MTAIDIALEIQEIRVKRYQDHQDDPRTWRGCSVHDEPWYRKLLIAEQIILAAGDEAVRRAEDAID